MGGSHARGRTQSTVSKLLTKNQKGLPMHVCGGKAWDDLVESLGIIRREAWKVVTLAEEIVPTPKEQ